MSVIRRFFSFRNARAAHAGNEYSEYSPNFSGEKTMSLRESLLYAVAAHLLIIFLFSVFGARCTDGGKKDETARTVQLHFQPRRERKVLTGIDPRQSAPGDKAEDTFWTGKGSQDRQATRKKSRITDKDSPGSGRESTEHTPIPLSRDMAAPHGHLDNPDSGKIDNPDKDSLEQDYTTRAGNEVSPGRDRATTGRGDEAVDESDPTRKREGDRGKGVRGSVNVRGRQVVYKPTVELPPRYSKLGLSFTVQIGIQVSPEGLVIRAGVEKGVGRPDLERRLVQVARRYRFEAVPEDGIQEGTITFFIRPKKEL